MTVRLTPHRPTHRCLLYGGVETVVSDGRFVILFGGGWRVTFPLVSIAEILLDDEPGDWW